MVKNIFVQVYYKLIQYLYQLKNKLISLVSAKKFIHGDLNECQKKNPAGSDDSFTSSLINSYSLSDVKFKGSFLINSNISVFRRVIDLYF